VTASYYFKENRSDGQADALTLLRPDFGGSAPRRHRGRPHRPGEPRAQGPLVDPTKIGATADRILRHSGVARCSSTKIAHGVFTWNCDEKAMDYEERLLSGRYVITTSLDEKTAPTAQVVGHYKALQSVECRFRVLKDFLALRPVFHYTEKRVRGHVAICVLAAVIEAVMALDLVGAKISDPDLEGQRLIAPGASRARAGPDGPLQ